MYWNALSQEAKTIINTFGEGINTYVDEFSINDGQLTNCLNLTCDDFPAIRTRNDRELSSYPMLTTPFVLGKRDSTTLSEVGSKEIHILDGDEWKYTTEGSTSWTKLSSGLDQYRGNFVQFKTQTNSYLVLANNYNATIKPMAYDGAAMVSLTSDAPQSLMYASHKYRLFGIESDKRTIKYCSQGDLTDWVTADDAGSIDLTNSNGIATAIRTFADHVIIWCESSLHELYGTEPGDYNLVDVSNQIGCIGHSAHVESNGNLYWMDYNGVYMYTGGQPSLISNNVKKFIDGINWDYKELITAGTFKNKIYFNIPFDASTANNKILVYDTSKNIWMIEDGSFIQFSEVGEKMLGLNTNGYIYNMHSTGKTGFDNSTAISWNLESKAMIVNADLSRQNTVNDMWIQHSGSTLATMQIDYTTNINSTSYTSLISSSDLSKNVNNVKDRFLIPHSKLNNIDFYKLKIYGTGFKKINNITSNIINYGG